MVIIERKMRVLSVILISLNFAADAEARRRRESGMDKRQLRYEDCGMDPDRPIRLVNFTAWPMPIRTPGKLRLAVTVNVTETLPPTLGVDVIITKYFGGIPFKIPCYNNIGTCHYKDVCSLLKVLYPRKRDCPRKLRRNDIPCQCTFPAGQYTLTRVSFPIPKLSGVLGYLAKGQYEARLRIYDESDKKELGCVTASFYMKKRHRKRHTLRKHHRKRKTAPYVIDNKGKWV